MESFLRAVVVAYLCGGFFSLFARSEEPTSFEEEPGVANLLAVKYSDYSYVLAKNHDYASSSYFDRLSKEASENGSFGERFKSCDTVMGRPEQIADMYFLFNCWHYFETNNKNLGEATICKNSFLKLNSILSKNRKKVKVGGSESPAQEWHRIELTQREEIILSEFIEKGSIDITFDYDSYKLNLDAVTKIGLVLRYLNILEDDYKIALVGHADRSGKSIYNNTIARRRANTILNTLLKNGIPRDLVEVQASGSRSPRIITKKDTKNQYNRRVEVILKTNHKIQNFLPEPILPSGPSGVDATTGK